MYIDLTAEILEVSFTPINLFNYQPYYHQNIYMV